MPPASPEPLTPAVLHVLLALAEEDKHGYAIAQDVEALTDGRVRMGPGTLYGTIQRLLAAGLVGHAASPARERDERRRYYRLTAAGRKVLAAELARLDTVVEYARARNLLPPELA
jgi:DNA-binding PadR family transcriptional regulator